VYSALVAPVYGESLSFQSQQACQSHTCKNSQH